METKMDAAKMPKTLQEAIVHFSDPERAFQHAVALRWPTGKVTCPRCDTGCPYFVASRRLWVCKGCKRQFTVKVGTIFEDSAIGMDNWMIALWLVVNSKNGISSYEIARHLGVTQKTAWFMAHRIRRALQTGSFVKLGGNGGAVEVDETFIGGKARNMHLAQRQRRITGTGAKDKTAVLGFLERGGEVRARVVPSRRRHVLQPEVKKHVAAGAALYTDALPSYTGLKAHYAHEVIDRASAYVNGKVHTNGLENFWSLLKRGINGTYVSVEPFHLFRYLDEQTFRYNNRKCANDGERFKAAMQRISGRCLTYNQLTGKELPLHQ
jgi:transposase-like protein